MATKKETERLDQLTALIGGKVSITVQHNIKGHRTDPRVFTGEVLAIAQKVGNDMGHTAEFTSPRGVVLRQDTGEVLFITMRNIVDYAGV